LGKNSQNSEEQQILSQNYCTNHYS